jgi:hypothetical protein
MKKVLAIILCVCMMASLCVIGAGAEGTNVAKIGTTEYATLDAAITAANDNDTVTLLKNAEISSMITLNKSITLNLNGFKASKNDGNSFVQVINGATLTIDGTKANSEFYGRINLGIATNNNGNAVLNGGKYSCTNAQTVLHINGTCLNSNVTISGATITSPTDNGIQLNGKGTFTIENSTITGATAVYIKAGTLTINNSTLTGNMSPVNYSYNGNGANATGDAIVVDACNYPGGNPTIIINSGSFSGTKSAVGYYQYNSGTASISITGGTFSSASVLNYLASGANVSVKLAADETGNVVIPANTTVNLDLNGKTLTGATAYPNSEPTDVETYNSVTALVNNGSLTINDSSTEKTGRITAAGMNASAFYNNEGATAILNGGTFTTGLAAANTDEATGLKDALYVIRNHGDMTLNDGVKVTCGGNYIMTTNSMITNGCEKWEHSDQREFHLSNNTNAKMTVNGGIYDGGIFVIKNGDWDGEMTINGGTFTITKTTSDGVLHWGVVVSNSNNCTMNITGGTFVGSNNGQDPVVKAKTKSTTAEGSGLTITGGTFTGTSDVLQTMNKDGGTNVAIINVQGGNFKGTINQFTEADDSGSSYEVNTSKFTISGGYFTSDPAKYAADGKVAAQSDITGYTYMIKDVAANVEVTVADPVVNNVEAPADKPPMDDSAVSALNTAAQGVSTAPTDTGLPTAAGNVAATVNDSTKTDAAAELNKAGVNTTGSGTTVTVVIEPKLDVTPIYYDSSENQLTLNIKATYDVIATTASDPNNIDLTGGPGTKNAVTLSTGNKLNVDYGTPVVIKTKIPSAMAVETSQGSGVYKPLTIKHIKENGAVYYYEAAVTQESSVYYATFTVTHGFSEFTLQAQDIRTGTVNYQNKDGGALSAVTYKITDVNSTALPTATAPSGQYQTGWKIDKQTYVLGTFTDAMLTAINGKTVTATPVFASIPVSTGTAAKSFTITAKAGDNGAIAPNGAASVASGKDQTYTITPNKGYDVADVLVDGKSVGAVKTYTFSAVTADHTISVTFKTASWVNPFTDVAENDWFYSYVQYANENGLFAGLTPTAFGPGATMTRGMLVTVLYGMAGKPAVTAAASFSDVNAGDYYANAVAWASANKIVSGYSNGKFGPNDPVTREQLATILYAYAAAKGYDTTQGGMAVREFSDYGSISNYALTAMQWAVNAGILQGTNGKLMPGSNATRAQVAAMLTSFCKNVAK